MCAHHPSLHRDCIHKIEPRMRKPVERAEPGRIAWCAQGVRYDGGTQRAAQEARVAKVRESMRRQRDQNERHHRSFLLYAMQHPDHRSLRAVANAMRASDNSIRKWRGREKWEERLTDPEHCQHACDAYATLYHSVLGGKDVEIIRERLGGTYVQPEEGEKNELARAVDMYEQHDREAAAMMYSTEARRRNESLRGVLEGVLAKVGEGIADQSIKPKASDISTVIRGFESLDRSEVRRLQMLPSSDDGEKGGGDVMATSQRVLQAQASGGDILHALEEDAEELLLVIRTMRTHEEESNVVRFPEGAQEAAEG